MVIIDLSRIFGWSPTRGLTRLRRGELVSPNSSMTTQLGTPWGGARGPLHWRGYPGDGHHRSRWHLRAVANSRTHPAGAGWTCVAHLFDGHAIGDSMAWFQSAVARASMQAQGFDARPFYSDDRDRCGRRAHAAFFNTPAGLARSTPPVLVAMASRATPPSPAVFGVRVAFARMPPSPDAGMGGSGVTPPPVDRRGCGTGFVAPLSAATWKAASAGMSSAAGGGGWSVEHPSAAGGGRGVAVQPSAVGGGGGFAAGVTPAAIGSQRRQIRPQLRPSTLSTRHRVRPLRPVTESPCSHSSSVRLASRRGVLQPP